MNWATAEPEDSPRRWWRLALIAAATVIAATVAVTVFALRREAGRVEGMLADIRARGEPVTGAELDAFYARPKAEEDATELWVRALAEVERTIELPRSGEYSKVPIQGNAESAGRRVPLPGAQWDDLTLSQQYLHEVAASMEALHTAADFGGHTRYPGSIADTTRRRSHGSKPCAMPHAGFSSKRTSERTRETPRAWQILCTPPSCSHNQRATNRQPQPCWSALRSTAYRSRCC